MAVVFLLGGYLVVEVVLLDGLRGSLVRLDRMHQSWDVREGTDVFLGRRRVLWSCGLGLCTGSE
jgi:hypothetical protein